MKRIALIPAYEPGETLRKIVTELAESNFEVVVVDDGSGKDYISVFDGLKEYAHVISYEENHGKLSNELHVNLSISP